MTTSVFPPHSGVADAGARRPARQRWPLTYSAALVFGVCGAFWVCVVATIITRLR